MNKEIVIYVAEAKRISSRIKEELDKARAIVVRDIVAFNSLLDEIEKRKIQEDDVTRPGDGSQ